MKEMLGGCCVCSDENGWTDNPLIYCDGPDCEVAVHQGCYGIQEVPEGEWLCAKCTASSSCTNGAQTNGEPNGVLVNFLLAFKLMNLENSRPVRTLPVKLRSIETDRKAWLGSCHLRTLHS